MAIMIMVFLNGINSYQIKNSNTIKMKQLSIKILVFFALFIGLETLIAQTKLPSILSDNMCLQQLSDVKIWGWDEPGQLISISPSWAKTITTKTNQEGEWQVTIRTPKAGKKGSMKVIGSTKEAITNILFGEVWLCSGQSNMQRQLGLRDNPT